MFVAVGNLGATIASTESLLSLSPPFTLGITTVATRGGQGASGGSLRSSSPFAGSSQPAAFWSYQNGAEAAQGFANYIRAYQPNLAPLLGDARAFFDPAGPILGSNYYVPTPGGLPASRYYANWQKVADEYDPKNERGHAEAFFEAGLIETLVALDRSNPKELARVARERDWETRDFEHPVRLRDRMPVPPAGPTIAVGGALAAAGAGVAVWWWLRRRNDAA